ncbi:MAG: NAD-dependent epimerase/dehydratase family protein [Acidobacteria bacterium]|nr:NAD-dependent epimerase/dehydratase family protein [Acidobacteriota bacterium]
MNAPHRSYRGKRALVTGGLGFLGGNLALRLNQLGASVTVVDSMVPGCGSDPGNLDSARGAIRLVHADIGDTHALGGILADTDVVFNLAGEISHLRSMTDPQRDLALNTVAQLQFLSELAARRPGIRVVYAGTRQVYGAPRYLPVDELHPVDPVDFNGVHKYTATMYHLLMAKTGVLDSVILRLTNIYGPRMSLTADGQGVLSFFLRRLLEGQDLEVFGTGEQVRDPLFVDDAVEAFLLAGEVESPPSRAYNAGGPEPLTLLEMAREMIRASGGSAKLTLRPFPDALKAIDIGSYLADNTRATTELGWKPTTSFEDGMRATFDYFRNAAAQRPMQPAPGQPLELLPHEPRRV